jgi:hypothetical protein
MRDGVKNFEIWPAATAPQNIPTVTREKINEFLDDSRKLLESEETYVEEELLP